MRTKKLLVCFAAVLIAGVMLGSILRVKYPHLPVWNLPVLCYGMRASDDAFLPVFRETAVWSAVWLTGIAMLGLTLFAIPGVLMQWLLHGVRIGAALAAIYRKGHLLGFVIAGVMVWLSFLPARR